MKAASPSLRMTPRHRVPTVRLFSAKTPPCGTRSKRRRKPLSLPFRPHTLSPARILLVLASLVPTAILLSAHDEVVRLWFDSDELEVVPQVPQVPQVPLPPAAEGRLTPNVSDIVAGSNGELVQELPEMLTSAGRRKVPVAALWKPLSSKTESEGLNGPSAMLADEHLLQQSGNRLLSRVGFEIHRHPSYPDNEFYACRFYRICRDPQGKLLLPQSHQASGKLETCGITAMKYQLLPDAVFKTGEEDAAKSQILASGARKGSGALWWDRDWISGTLARYHMPHFVPDVMPGLFALDGAIRGGSVTLAEDHHHATAENRVPSYKSVVFDQSGAGLVLPPQMNGVKPTFVIEDKIRDLGNESWVHRFVDMVPPFQSDGAGMEPGARKWMSESEAHGRVSGSGTVPGGGGGRGALEGAACFRSALVSSNSRVDFGAVFDEHSYFYRYNKLSRHHVEDQFEGGGGSMCIIQILIINRRGGLSKDGRVKLGRDIPNVDEVSEALLAKGKELRIEVRVRVEYFEEISFETQVQVVQQADIVVGVHGAALTNLIFARRGALLVEILPYTYYAGPFDGLAASLGLELVREVAQPDVERFSFCLDAYNPTGSVSHSDSQLLKRIFAERAAEFASGAANFSNLQLHVDTPGVPANVTFARPCARSQRLRVDPQQVARPVFHAVRRICHSRDSLS